MKLLRYGPAGEEKPGLLDQDDTIVRRRLVQKMEFLSEDMAVQTDPPDDAIADYFNANIEDFRVRFSASTTFTFELDAMAISDTFNESANTAPTKATT